MFTGIIEKVGAVVEAQLRGFGELSGGSAWIDTGFEGLTLGESVAVNGVCLTVAELRSRGVAVFYISPETRRRTNLGELSVGTRVNLERALTLDQRLSGHLVQGHVDGRGTVREIAIAADGESRRMVFELDHELARYCVEKGAIAINGVSLTINLVRGNEVEVMLIPHTWRHTNLSLLTAEDNVNVEVDVIAKYVEKLCQPYLKPSNI
jgi:riboflavin synthase